MMAKRPMARAAAAVSPGAERIFVAAFVVLASNCLPADKLKAVADGKEDSQVVSYCTGGIRSGFVTAC